MILGYQSYFSEQIVVSNLIVQVGRGSEQIVISNTIVQIGASRG
jgi:hypothetical protein